MEHRVLLFRRSILKWGRVVSSKKTWGCYTDIRAALLESRSNSSLQNRRSWERAPQCSIENIYWINKVKCTYKIKGKMGSSNHHIGVQFQSLWFQLLWPTSSYRGDATCWPGKGPFTWGRRGMHASTASDDRSFPGSVHKISPITAGWPEELEPQGQELNLNVMVRWACSPFYLVCALHFVDPINVFNTALRGVFSTPYNLLHIATYIASWSIFIP